MLEAAGGVLMGLDLMRFALNSNVFFLLLITTNRDGLCNLLFYGAGQKQRYSYATEKYKTQTEDY